MPVTLQTFADKPPPWQLSLLDANFAEIAEQLNSGLLGTLYLVDTGAPNALLVQLPAGLTLTLQAGVFLQVRAANTTTAGLVTLDIQGVSTNAIVNPPANALGIGQIQQGGNYGLQFDGTNWQLVSASGPGGTYTPAFQSGSIQINYQGAFGGFGDFQLGFALPNASGIPSFGILLGGAGKTQVVEVTDAQLPGQKGITKIRSAGDAGDTTSDGGDLLDFAGGSVNGKGGAATYQAGTSVNSIAGDATLAGGNATGTVSTAQAGNAVVSSGQVGKKVGIGVILSANTPPGATGVAVIRHQFGLSSTVLAVDEYPDGSMFLYDIVGHPTRGGFGLLGQPVVSGGPGAPFFYQVAYSGTKVINGDTYVWSSGILKTVNGQIT
jgi:hypothetical protein